MICTRCLLPGEHSPEAGICQKCYQQAEDAKFSVMMRESVAETKSVTSTCAICDKEFQRRKAGIPEKFCPECRLDGRKLEAFRRRHKIRTYHPVATPTACDSWYVDYDPIPLDEGGFEKGVLILRGTMRSQEFYDSIAFAPGTILRNSRTGKTITIHQKGYKE
jgi:hypothetical protein